MTSILFTSDNGIATVTLNRPDKLNAFGGTMREELLEVLERIERDSALRVVVLTGAGRAFCAGGDVRAMGQLRDQGDEHRFAQLLDMGQRVVSTLRRMPQPSIAAVNGVAAGAGFSLAAACDLRLAASDARFIASFGKLGLHPDWGLSYTLPRLVGPAKALELALTAEPLEAEEALRMGLVNRVVPSELLLEAVLALASSIARRSPHAIAKTRQTFGQSVDREFKQVMSAEVSAQLACFRSEDLAEGIRAFHERREPEFKGR